MPKLQILGSHVDAVVFDAYGTLFDVHSAVAKHAQGLPQSAVAISEMWRAKQIEYSWIYGLIGHFVPFWALTERALDYSLSRHGVNDPTIREGLLDAYKAIEPFPDSRSTLIRLRELGSKTAILTNANQTMIDAAVGFAKLGDLLDMVISVEEIGRYKTDPKAYQLLCDRIDIPASRIAFVSSNAWDVAGASAFGMASIWVRRTGNPPEYPEFPPKAVVQTLSEVL